MTFLFFLLSCNSSRKTVITKNESRKAFSFYYEALSYIEKGEFNAALSNLDSAIYYQPNYFNFYFVKGRVFEFLQRPDSSIKSYERAVELKSHYPEAWDRLGNLFLLEKDFANAAINFKKAIQSKPDSINYYLKLGQCYFRLKKYHLALDRLSDYQQLSQHHSIELKKWQGLANYGLSEYQKAANLLEIYTMTNSYDTEALKYLGLAKFNLKEYDQAISALNKAINFNNMDPEIYLYRARYFLIQNKKGNALEQLQVGLTYDSLNTDLLFELGKFYFQEQKISKSKKYLDKVISINRNYWAAYRYLGFIAEQENKLDEALFNYKLFIDNTLIKDAEVNQRIANIQKILINK
jgi:tetratricopeptide (TPR) repeat protein